MNSINPFGVSLNDDNDETTTTATTTIRTERRTIYDKEDNS